MSAKASTAPTSQGFSTGMSGSRAFRYLGAWLWFCVCLFGAGVPGAQAASVAKSSTVAVMPFRDLAGGTKFIGEAIRETVTNDLKELGGLRLVERGNLDRVLAEQNLQVHRQDVDVAAVVRVGKILGAQLIVIGAYQKFSPQVRLTARFIKVETSEVVGSAKVDGSTGELLRLQDRVTVALLRSVGLHLQAKKFETDNEKRPDLQSLKTLELYGQAVTATDDNMRRDLLAAVVLEDKSFSYAVKDLAELEKRLKKYQSVQDQVVAADMERLRAQLRTETDREKLAALTMQLLMKLQAARRYRELAKEARIFLDGIPMGASLGVYGDGIGSLLVSADAFLKDDDAVLRDGEKFLQRSVGGNIFQAMKMQMESAIDRKRKVETGAEAARKAVAELNNDVRWNLYVVGAQYQAHQQFPAAQRLLKAALQVGGRTASEENDAYRLLALVDLQMGDWASLRTDLASWAKVNEAAAKEFEKSYAMMIPVDG